jgi:hypothetical protein
MAHFVELDDNNVVIRSIVVHNNELLVNGVESEDKGMQFCVDHYGGRWIQTSYNASSRGKYAGLGDSYDEEENIFIAPQPFPSWIRIGSFWQAPIEMPTDGKRYEWNETEGGWNELS